MKKVLDHVLSLFFYLWFGLVFLGFHVAGLIANAGGNRKSLLRTVEYFCLFIIRGHLILGNRVKFINDHSLPKGRPLLIRSEEHTSELQSLMRISYAVFCLKKKTKLQPTK